MKSSIPIVAAVTLLSGCAAIQETFQESPLVSAFSNLDEDGDGVISKQEAQAFPPLGQNFTAIDTNRSGGIDPDEYAAANTRLANLAFDEVDINGDGVISEREAAAMPISLREGFGDVDADADSNVSPVEYQAAQVILLEGVSFGTVDRDGDGVISQREAQGVAPLAEVYDTVDTDEDGLISQEEFAAAQRCC
jgi:Ca2+-binding EF-hand superfamily protein